MRTKQRMEAIMKMLRHLNKLLVGIFALLPVLSHAAEENCAVLSRFEGDVQILNSTRTELVYTTLRAMIPCGGWITVHQGWARITHKSGVELRLGPETFAELYGAAPHAILYRGRMLVESDGGTPEFKAVTANGEITFKRGHALVAYSPGDEETQLIVLENEAHLSNRFVASRKTRVRAGEMSALNLKLLRVVPTNPAAMTTASMKEVLEEMPVSQKEKTYAVAVAQKREERNFPSNFAAAHKKTPRVEENTGKNKVIQRALASSPAQAAQGNQRWLSRLTGGDPAGTRILNPTRVRSKSRKSSIQVIDPAYELDRKKFREEEDEKKKLIDELSQIRVE